MLVDSIKQDIITSLKSGDTLRAETMRFLLSAVRNDAIAKYGAAADTSLTDDDVLAVVKKQVKSHQESVDVFSKAGRRELADKEQQEMDILKAFLPPELTDEELSAVIDRVIADSGEKTFGPLMGKIMTEVGSRADGKRVSALLSKALG